MAASFVHQCFGEAIIQLADKSLREKIIKYKDYFDIGLQGPDIFFYYHPLKKSRIRDYGITLHHQEAYPFFKEMYERVDDAGYVYLLGFILHFILDSTLHPYINEVVKKDKVSHFGIERELELYFFKERNKEVEAPAKQFKVSTAKKISDYLHIEQEIMEEIIHQFQYYNHFLYHPSLKIRRFGGKLLNILHIPFGDMFILNHYDESLSVYLKECVHLYPIAINDALNVLNALEKGELSSRLKRDYE